MNVENAGEKWRANVIWRLISLLPFAEAVAVLWTSNGQFRPMFARPPDISGIPLGVVIEALLLAWAALGARVIWTTRSPAMATLAMFATTIPSMVLQLLTPALILIMQNMTV